MTCYGNQLSIRVKKLYDKFIERWKLHPDDFTYNKFLNKFFFRCLCHFIIRVRHGECLPCYNCEPRYYMKHRELFKMIWNINSYEEYLLFSPHPAIYEDIGGKAVGYEKDGVIMWFEPSIKYEDIFCDKSGELNKTNN